MTKYPMSNKERLIRRKFRGKASFRIMGNDFSGYKLVIKNTDEKTYNKLKKMEKTLEKAFEVEIVNFV